jgi:apolipoprotein N-acyltransferase
MLTKLNRFISTHSKFSAFILGIALTLSFSPFEFLPALFITMPIFLHLLYLQNSQRQAFSVGFAFGYGHCLSSLYWITNALFTDITRYWYLVPISVLGIPIIGAVYITLATTIAWRFRKTPTLYTIALALSWTTIEYLRCFYIIPFPLNLIGHTAIAIPQLAILAKIIGTFGLSIFLLMTSSLLYNIRNKYMVLASLLSLVIALGTGQVLLNKTRQKIPLQLPAARLIQPNVFDYNHTQHDLYRVKYQTLHKLSNQERNPETKLIIWPESAFPLTLIPEAMRKQIAAEIIPKGGFLISGSIRNDATSKELSFYNSLVVLDDTGVIVHSYDKHLLAPFGEYIPYQKYLPNFIQPFLEKMSVGEFNAGTGKQGIKLFGNIYLPSICFEGAFPQFFQNTFLQSKVDFLLNITNDMWFGKTIGPYQHLTAARFRAIEMGKPMLRVANTGISAVITPEGRLYKSLGIDEAGFIDVGI